MGMFSEMDCDLQNCETSDQVHTLLQSYGLQRGTEFYSKCFKHWYDTRHKFDTEYDFKQRLESRLMKGEDDEKV